MRNGTAKRILASLFISTQLLIAQSNVTTNGGSANAIPKFSDGSTITNSSITEVDGNVGIGTSTPAEKLDVQGHVASSGQIRFHTWYADTGGTTGIVGNSNGWTRLDPNGGRFIITATTNDVTNKSNLLDVEDQQNWNHWIELHADGGGFFLGNIGVGTNAPTAKLEVNGNLKISQNSGASMTYADGTVQSTAWNGTTCGGDYAESVDVVGDKVLYEPGDVIMIDEKGPQGAFRKSLKPYSTMVAGVYSTKPGLTGRRDSASRPREEEVPMAMMGIVPTKVSTENGPIRRGDLLVSSATPGYAMKGTDRKRMMGAVIGKALDSFESGHGVIEVLVSLQ